jgi:DNA helicase-2/ATP-dependent DNA helicase PcrA
MDLYEGFKKERGLMDFDDLQTRFLSLLEDKELTARVRRTFTHILVDEFQDLDPVQLQLLVKLSEGGSIFCVGDEDQCIYAFRGSDPSAMMDFEERFKGSKLYLKYNYRSSRTIVDYAGEVIRFNRERNDKELLPDRKDLTRIRKVFPPSQEGMLSDISNEVMKDIYGSYAVLYRTNEEGERIREHLRRESIPFRCRDGYSFYRTMVARDILEYMRYAATGDPRHFARVANKPYRYIPKDDLRRMASGEDVKTVLLSGEKGDFAKGRMKDLIHDLKPMAKKSPRDLVRYVGKVLGYEDYLKDYSERTGRDLDELSGDLEEMLELAGNHKVLNAFLEESMKEPESDPSAKLLLSTIHGVKGLEFDKVFLVNCVEGIMPQAVTGADLEEERRIFYVGITRARHELDIYSPRTIHGKERKRSRFVI